MGTSLAKGASTPPERRWTIEELRKVNDVAERWGRHLDPITDEKPEDFDKDKEILQLALDEIAKRKGLEPRSPERIGDRLSRYLYYYHFGRGSMVGLDQLTKLDKTVLGISPSKSFLIAPDSSGAASSAGSVGTSSMDLSSSLSPAVSTGSGKIPPGKLRDFGIEEVPEGDEFEIEPGEDTFTIDEEYPEGKEKTRLLILPERSRKAVKKRKAMMKDRFGHLFCEGCKMIFTKRYGLNGERCAECHHPTPLAKGERKTRVVDLQVLCSNCHRIIHFGPKGLMTLTELQLLLNDGGTSKN